MNRSQKIALRQSVISRRLMKDAGAIEAADAALRQALHDRRRDRFIARRRAKCA